jgi:hypothetical protein
MTAETPAATRSKPGLDIRHLVDTFQDRAPARRAASSERGIRQSRSLSRAGIYLATAAGCPDELREHSAPLTLGSFDPATGEYSEAPITPDDSGLASDRGRSSLRPRRPAPSSS